MNLGKKTELPLNGVSITFSKERNNNGCLKLESYHISCKSDKLIRMSYYPNASWTCLKCIKENENGTSKCHSCGARQKSKNDNFTLEEIDAYFQGRQNRIKNKNASQRDNSNNKNNNNINYNNYGGIVLYAYNGKSEWYLNGIHCKSGYIIIKQTNIDNELPKSSLGQIHGSIYKSLFGCGCDKNVVASGFAYINGKWRFKSASFNLNFNNYEMTTCEIKLLKTAIHNWRKYGIRNTTFNQDIFINIQKK